LAFLAAPFLVVGNSPLISVIARATTQSPDVIPSPDKWIPFTAEGLIDNASRGKHLLGRHYRASDGSERWEQGNPVSYVSIRNIAQATFYEWYQRQPGVWNAHPMELPNGQWRPVKFARGGAGLTNETRVVEQLQLYKQVDASGREAWLAPALNFFPVLVTKSPVLGTLQAYSRFELNEPDPALFLPPDGAVIRHSVEPRGITVSQ